MLGQRFLTIVAGDLGRQDEDGFLYVIDRLSELIHYNGYKIAPAVLEDILLRHDAVADAGVVGIPDDIGGELPRAYVVKQPGTNVTEKKLLKFVEGNINKFWYRLKHNGPPYYAQKYLVCIYIACIFASVSFTAVALLNRQGLYVPDLNPPF